MNRCMPYLCLSFWDIYIQILLSLYWDYSYFLCFGYVFEIWNLDYNQTSSQQVYSQMVSKISKMLNIGLRNTSPFVTLQHSH